MTDLTTTRPPQQARRMAGFGLLAAAAVAAWAIAAPSPPVATDASAPANPATATVKIVPADVLGISVPWSPLTGDGSN